MRCSSALAFHRRIFLAALLIVSFGCSSTPNSDQKMKITDALPTLKRMITEAKVNIKHPTPQLVWPVFQRFAARPSDCASEGFLFECGVYSFTGKPMFQFSFVRQFTIEKHGDYDHMQQLHVIFYFTPTWELEQLRYEKWSFDFQTLDEFFRFVEGRTEFRAIVDSAVHPAEVEIYQERI
jgi:hypothetical protein